MGRRPDPPRGSFGAWFVSRGSSGGDQRGYARRLRGRLALAQSALVRAVRLTPGVCPASLRGERDGVPVCCSAEKGGGLMGSVIKKRRKRMAKKKHRKLLKKTRIQRRNKK